MGSPGGGLWKSTDAGQTWSPKLDDLPFAQVRAIAISPTNPNKILIGAGGNGILVSQDAGENFVSTGQIQGEQILKILFHPTNDQIVFACSVRGLYKSTDGGSTWIRSTTLANFAVEDVEFHPTNPSIVYASARDFYKSTDGGTTFTQVTNGINGQGRTLIAVTPTAPEYVYVMQAVGNIFDALYRSTDAGNSFQTRIALQNSGGVISNNFLGYASQANDALGQAGVYMDLAVSPSNPQDVLIGGINVWGSTDGGSSFSIKTIWDFPFSQSQNIGYIHGDVSFFSYQPGNTVFCGTAGGIFVSNDRGNNWEDLSTGLGIRQFNRIDCADSNPSVIAGGSNDMGHSIKTAAGWFDWTGNTGTETIIDPRNEMWVYGTSSNGRNLYRTTNGGNNIQSLPVPEFAGDFHTPINFDMQNPDVLYAAYNQVYKFENDVWTQLSNFPAGSVINTMAVSPADPNYIYVNKGLIVYWTRNGGQTWASRVLPPGVDGGLSIAVRLEAHPTEPETVLVVDINDVFITRDAFDNLENIVSDLPRNEGTKSCEFEGGEKDGIYVGTSSGVYYTNNDINGWVDYSLDLPMAEIRDMDIQPGAQLLRVATFGRGAWETPTYASQLLGNVPPFASFVSPTDGKVCEQPELGPVQFTLSATDPDGDVVSVEISIPGLLDWTDVGAAPYVYTWTPPSFGTYTVLVRATDNDGTLSEVTSITITVQELLGVCDAKKWNQNRIYDLDDFVVQDGIIYRAKWYNVGIEPPVPWGPWEFTEVCDQSLLLCGELEWSPRRHYVLGQRVRYEGRVYEANWGTTNVPSTMPWGAWTLIDFCEAPLLNCSSTPEWDNSQIYSEPNNFVRYQGKRYYNMWWTESQEPGISPVWFFVGPCEGAGKYTYFDASHELSVYPNPGSGYFWVDFSTSEPVVLQVLDARGVTVKEDSFESAIHTAIDLTGYPAGIYQVLVQGENSVHQRTIMLNE